MKIRRQFLAAALALAACALAAGCASTNVNPATPKANTGYIDLYTSPSDALCWDIRRVDEGEKELFSDLDPLTDVRLAFRPGRHRLRITFLDRVIAEPALVDVDIQDASITPVLVTLEDSGAASVRSKDTTYGGTAYGRWGRRTRISTDESKVYRVKATPQAARPYQPKERMDYFAK